MRGVGGCWWGRSQAYCGRMLGTRGAQAQQGRPGCVAAQQQAGPCGPGAGLRWVCPGGLVPAGRGIHGGPRMGLIPRAGRVRLQPLRQPRAQDPHVWGLLTRTVSDMHAGLCAGGASSKRPLWDTQTQPRHTHPARSGQQGAKAVARWACVREASCGATTAPRCNRKGGRREKRKGRFPVGGQIPGVLEILLHFISEISFIILKSFACHFSEMHLLGSLGEFVSHTPAAPRQGRWAARTPPVPWDRLSPASPVGCGVPGAYTARLWPWVLPGASSTAPGAAERAALLLTRAPTL